jgi:hypothetical protein
MTLFLSPWFAEVPLEVLPGCESEFRSLVNKVIFGCGEDGVAGVRRVAAVSVRIEGLPIGERKGKGGDGDDDDNDDEGTGRDVDDGLV